MYGIDEITRTPKNLVLKDGTDRLMVEATGVTLTAGDITLDVTGIGATADAAIAAGAAGSINAKLRLITTQNAAIIALLTTIATNTTP